MKAHKENNGTHTRLSLLEQSHEYTIRAMQDIKYQIQTLSNDMKSEFKTIRLEVDDRFKKIDIKFDKVYQHFDKIDKRFDKVDERFDRIDSKIGEFKKEMVSRFDKTDSRVYNILFAFCASVISYVVAKVYHLI